MKFAVCYVAGCGSAILLIVLGTLRAGEFNSILVGTGITVAFIGGMVAAQ